MPFTWLLSSKHDVMIRKGGSVQKVYGAEEVRQRILVHLLHKWQEYFMNVPAGIPWDEVLLGSKDLKLIETWVRKEILDVLGVVSIINVDVMYSTTVKRQLIVNANVEVYGLSGPSIVTIENQVLGGV